MKEKSALPKALAVGNKSIVEALLFRKMPRDGMKIALYIISNDPAYAGFKNLLPFFIGIGIELLTHHQFGEFRAGWEKLKMKYGAKREFYLRQAIMNQPFLPAPEPVLNLMYLQRSHLPPLIDSRMELKEGIQWRGRSSSVSSV
jgi:hypothetical protein